MASGPLRVGVLAYPDCFASEIFGVTDLLTVANRVFAGTVGGVPPSTAPFQAAVVSPRRRVAASGGVSVGVSSMAPIDLLLVPGFELVESHDLGARLARLRPEIEAIRSTAEQGTPVVSICVGAFLLGEAGLLDGRRATTAWLFADALARRYPAARITAEALVLHDSGVTTTAAFSSMYDFTLDLVRSHCDDDVARRTARVTLVDDARRSQSPYVDEAMLPASGRGFSDGVKDWLENHLADAYRLAELSTAFHVSTRTMLRRFRAETGETPLSYLQRMRVHRAKALLESTDLHLAEIVSAVGYLDPGTFRRLFAAHTGFGPTDYRRRFRGAATS